MSEFGISPSSWKAIEQHSDMGRERLSCLARLFVSAHLSCPMGITIEVGTCAGGSSLLWLCLLEQMYPTPPFLFTVDPYVNIAEDGGTLAVVTRKHE